MSSDSTEKFKNGDLLNLRATVLTGGLSFKKSGVVPYFVSFRDMYPAGYLPDKTAVIAVECGSFFCKCMSAAGVVYFRLENLVEAP